MSPTAEQFDALFEPRGVIVAGASTHPGKFGFVSLHNLLAGGYRGRVFATNRDASTVLGIETMRSLDELPEGAADLMFVCTPKSVVPELLRTAAAKGVRAAFLTTAGYGESDEQGRLDEDELVELCERARHPARRTERPGRRVHAVELCAPRSWRRRPPPGRIGVASQSGNFVSSFMNWSCATGVGISRAVSAGNAAATSVADYLAHYASDPATSVGLAYVEGIADGRGFFESRPGQRRRDARGPGQGRRDRGRRPRRREPHRIARERRPHLRRRLPPGRRDPRRDRRGGLRGGGDVRHPAASGRQPRRRDDHRRRVGRGHRRRDHRGPATSSSRSLPDDLLAEIDEHLPPRWSRNNPVDLAGGETRDTIPDGARADRRATTTSTPSSTSGSASSRTRRG